MKHLSITIIGLVLLVSACRQKTEGSIGSSSSQELDSVLVSLSKESPEQFFHMLDILEETRKMPEYKVNYYRADYYNTTRQLRSTEFYYKKALADDKLRSEPEIFYKACYNLSLTLYNKNDRNGAIEWATKGYAVAKRDPSSIGRNYTARLMSNIGSCQLRLNRYKEANDSYMQAYTEMQKLAKADSTYENLSAWAAMSSNILTDYSECDSVGEATPWIDRAEQAVGELVALGNCPADRADRMKARLLASKAIIFGKQGKTGEAREAYNAFMASDFAKTDDGLIDRIICLQGSKRWNDLLALRDQLDSLDREWETPIDLEYLQGTLAMYFKASIESGRTQEALEVAQHIVNSLDTVMLNLQQDNATELAVIYETQEKEAQLAEQAAAMSKQRLVGVSGGLLLLLIFLLIFVVHRHKASKRLEQAHAQLQKAHRELEQSNADLMVANERAEESSRMKTNFIQQISHEIRTPLNVLSGFTQILTTPGVELDNDTKTDINQKVTENTDRITGLVNKMLELSDANSLAVIERTDEVLAVQIAAQAAEDSGIARAAHLTFDIETGDGVETVMLKTNLKQATRALTLLLDNARKFTTRAEAHQRHDVSEELQRAWLRMRHEGSEMQFIVEDTGIGVPASEAEHIFDEFVQLDEYYDGTGIGLTVARSIARRLGGDVTLDTTYTPGTRFVMTLPVEESGRD